MARCFAMKTNFMSLPSRSKPRPFLGYPAQPSVWSPHVAAVRSPAAPASSLHLAMAGKRLCRVGAELPDPLAQRVLVHVQITRSLCCRYPHSLTSLTASSLNSRVNLRLCMVTSGFMKHPISVSIKPAAAQSDSSSHETHFGTSKFMRRNKCCIAQE